MRSLWSVLGWAAVVLLVPGAGESEITGYSPEELTVGTLVTITGTFATAPAGAAKKPEVTGAREGAPKRVVFKVLEHDARSIVARVKKIPSSKQAPAAGSTWTLEVRPRGAQALASSQAGAPFTVVGPTLLGVDPEAAMPGEEVTVRVADPGPKRPRATIGGRKTKLRAPVREGRVVRYTARVPASLPDGAWDVAVSTRIGHDLLPAALTVFGSKHKLGKVRFHATVDGQAFSGEQLQALPTASSVLVAASSGGATERAFHLAVPFVVGVDAPPRVYVGLPTDTATLIYSEQTGQGAALTWTGGLDAFSVEVEALSGGQLAGSFLGTLSSAIHPDVDVEGDFIVDL